MIHLLAYEAKKLLERKKFPVPLVYGPEFFKRGSDTNLIVIHREGEADAFAAPAGPGRNPVNYQNRMIGFAVLVFAKSSVAGARRPDHELLCDVFVNAVICALHKAGVARSNHIGFSNGHLLTEAEREGAVFSGFPGVIYEIKARMLTSVQDYDWNGNGTTEVALDAVSTDVFTLQPTAENPDADRFDGTILVE